MTLARFGHHPDPAIDFCCEVDAIEGLAYDVSVGAAPRDDLFRSVSRAIDFIPGADELAVKAKARLNEIADTLA